MVKELLLYVHIAAGFSALVAAFVSAFTKILNGPHIWHLYSGRVFFFAMSAIFLTAVPISLITGNVFLLLVAVFSFYLAHAGWSYARNRSGMPSRLDRLRTYGMLAASLAMALFGVNLLLFGDMAGITMLIFSGIGGALSIGDLRTLKRGGVTGKERIGRHLTMMLAGSIATITAFLVVNFSLSVDYVLWLAPTVVITPLIIFWNKKIHGGMVPKEMPRNEE